MNMFKLVCTTYSTCLLPGVHCLLLELSTARFVYNSATSLLVQSDTPDQEKPGTLSVPRTQQARQASKPSKIQWCVCAMW
ncbi:hypothetical protein B0T20DRAFT_226181 [Sordaria brevicollis]|uniref:Secreted protein n=1 Tax=Sordaria brevicollis TaxID=83679 RepID=A0AAE0UB51_SORBR|nr:hypothetical protein B0T20DRAFT_226181 [Sordaria brevicollis]